MLIKFKRINDLRVDNDLTIKQISDIIGISVDNFYDYANGRSNFPLEKLDKLITYFKVSFDYITGLSNKKNYYNKKLSKKILQKRLREVRKDHKLSQEAIGKIIGDSQSTYANYENNISNIPISKLYLLAKYYNISIDYLVGKKDNKNI